MSRTATRRNHRLASGKRVDSLTSSKALNSNEPPGAQQAYVVLLGCFALSGATGLIYQMAWARLLVLVFGSTTSATATILAVFMGGLALGSAAGGRVADRVRRPVRVYGFLEAIIGVYAALVPALLTLSEKAFRWSWQLSGGSPGLMALVRVGLASVTLLPPTMLMGATLPLLSRFVSQGRKVRSARIGALYSANLVGAVAGAALGGLALLPALGTRKTLLTAAGINLLLFAGALVLDRRAQHNPPAPEPVPGRKAETAAPLRGARMAWACFTLSGALALLYEVAWTRALGLIIGSHSYAFTVMVTAFLLGLFVGCAVATRQLARVRWPLLALGLLQTTAAACALIACIVFDWLPWWNLRLFAVLPHAPEFSLATRFLLAVLILLPLALCLGAIFPFAVGASAQANTAVGAVVGRLYAGNTLGAITGALLGGFWLIPALGPQSTLRGALAAQAIVGLAVVWAAPRLANSRPQFGALLVAAVVTVVTMVSPFRWNEAAIILAQTARRAVADVAPFPYASREKFLEEVAEDQKVVFSEDGATSHVAVIENRLNRILLTNGHIDASSVLDASNQILLAALPLLLHSSAPERVGMIGWGSGATAGAALRFPIVSLTAIELEPKVLRASEWFRDINHDALRDPRMKMVITDGRAYLSATAERFDAIISEPSSTWQAAVCNLFTQGFFARVRARLTDHGLFSLWIGYSRMPAAEVRGVLAALRRVFPHILLFRSNRTDLIAVASTAPIRVALEETARRMLSPSVHSELERAGVPSVSALLSRLQAGDEEIAALSGRERPNTDDNARLEYAVARAYEQGDQAQEISAGLRRIDRRGLERYISFAGVSDSDRLAYLRALTLQSLPRQMTTTKPPAQR